MSVGSGDAWSPGRFVVTALVMAVVGAVGILAISLWGSVLYALAADVVWEAPLSGGQRQIVSTLAIGAATVMVTAGYLVHSGRSRSFIDVSWPSLRDVAWGIGGLVALFGLLQVISYAFVVFGVSAAEHTTTEAAQTDPTLLLPLIPLSLLVVGPGEELLYRNIVQKGLYDSAPTPVAVLTASVIFSLVHIPAYASGDTTGELAATLAVIFTLSLVLGTVYARTENLVVPAFVHGSYNAIVFATEYLDAVGQVAAAVAVA